MKIVWVEIPQVGWVASMQHHRAVVMNISDVWLARVEDGDVLYPASITFQALESAQAWAEHKLHQLANHPLN